MDARPVRLAELVGAMSLATDLANGFALEKTLRTTLVAVRLAAALDLDAATVRDVYYAAALRFIGCTGFAAEEAALADGDDIGFRHALLPADGTGDAVGRLWRDLGGGRGRGARTIARAIAAPTTQARHRRAACDAALLLIAPIGLPDGVARALTEVFERPDGRGLPRGLRGDAIAIAARVVATADLAEQLTGVLGVDGTRRELTRRAGRQLDAAVVTAYLALPPAAPPDSTWDAFLAAEPGPPLVAPDERVDAVCRAFGRFVDVRSPFTLGHADAVVALAGRMAAALGVDPAGTAVITRAAWLHDLGTLAVPLGVWDRPGPRPPIERGRCDEHPAIGERVVAVAPTLAAVARVIGRHHERLDGSGYHRGLRGDGQDVAARIVAVADVWAALGAARAHRPAYDHAAAATLLADEARAGRLDARAVEAALDLVGAPTATTPWPAGLSDREVEVLRLVAIGRTNPEIASLLTISAKTVQHHVSHVFDKLGVASRAGVALRAIELGLLAQA